MKALHRVAFILLVVGGLNWLLVGLIKWDIGSLLGGMDSILSRIVYVLVGVSAVFIVATHKKNCKDCGACGGCTTCSADAPKM